MEVNLELDKSKTISEIAAEAAKSAEEKANIANTDAATQAAKEALAAAIATKAAEETVRIITTLEKLIQEAAAAKEKADKENATHKEKEEAKEAEEKLANELEKAKKSIEEAKEKAEEAKSKEDTSIVIEIFDKICEFLKILLILIAIGSTCVIATFITISVVNNPIALGMIGSVIAAIAGAPAVVNMVNGNNNIEIELPNIDGNDVNDHGIIINDDENGNLDNNIINDNNNNEYADAMNANEYDNNNYTDTHTIDTIAAAETAAAINIVTSELSDKFGDKNTKEKHVEKIISMDHENKNTNDENLNVKIDTSWYSKTYNEFHIKTVAQLAGLADLVNKGNSFSGSLIYLDSNLDLNRIEWIPIGNNAYKNENKYFSGIFDGQGHIIDNLTLFESNSRCNSLFGKIYNGTIKNIGITNAKIKKTQNNTYGYLGLFSEHEDLGILSEQVENSYIINVYTTGSIVDKSHDTYYTGSIIGKCKGSTKIIGCYSSVDINSDCLNTNGYPAIGGLIGCWEDAKENDIISDCFFNGKIHCKNDYYIGGILGIESSEGIYEVKINNCFISTTDINCTSIDKIAWITTTQSSDITNCYWPDNKNTNGQKTINVVNYFERDLLKKINKIEKKIKPSTYGHAIKDFKDPAEQKCLVELLNKNANPSVRWYSNSDIYFTVSQLLANYTGVDSAINKANSFNETDFQNFEKVKEAIDKVERGKHIIYQDVVNNMAKDINDAIEQLQYNYANYSEVDEAIKMANHLNETDYINFEQVKKALKDVARGKNITEQNNVDKMAKDIEAAIFNLVCKKVDYSILIDSIINLYDFFQTYKFTNEELKTTTQSLNNNEKLSNILQSSVDTIAEAIKDSIQQLKYTIADYSAVQKAIDKSTALNKNYYTNFDEVENAINAVIEKKNITEQSEVDQMAQDIEDALKRLQYKDADYSAVEKAKRDADYLTKTDYESTASVEDAIRSVVYGKKINEQSAVDKMAKDINDAIEKLAYKRPDYSAVNSAIIEAERLYRENSIFYKDFSSVTYAIQSVKRGPNFSQDSVNQMAKNIRNAIESLELKDAEYSSLLRTIKRARDINKYEYKNFDKVEEAINAVDYGKKMTEQHVVRAMEVAIENAIKNLQYKDADYSKIDEAIKKAKALKGNKQYENKNFDEIDKAIQSVVHGKNFKEQCIVNRMAEKINNAIKKIKEECNKNEKDNK